MAKRTINIDKVEFSTDTYEDCFLVEAVIVILQELRYRADRDIDNSSGPGIERFEKNAKERYGQLGVALTAMQNMPKKL